MPESGYPLLVFPEPVGAERAKRAGGGASPKTPRTSEQGERLAPQLRRLQETLAQRRVALQDNPLGLQPEQVLVLETVGSVGDFLSAVKNVEGLEWLGEYELDDIPPGDGFEDESHPDRELKGQLFLVMTDERALQELRSLFDSWRKNPNAPFARGLAPLKRAFEHLRAIRPWDVEDRLHETGILDDWRERLTLGQEIVPFEVELWFRRDPERRGQAEAMLRMLAQSLNGEVTQQCVIPEIEYHAILGQIDLTGVRDLLDRPESRREIRLLQCDDIMFLRPVGQCAVPGSEDGTRSETLKEAPESTPPHGSPLVALLDGLSLTGHRLLDGRLVVDDPDGYENGYQAHERFHGTGMASLICHGDLNERTAPLDRPLYLRPILQPRRDFSGGFHEAILPHVLPVDLVHRAVRRLFEGENGEPPAAPSVRIVNLSVGDPARPLGREMSPWARLLDWLSWKYGVLFIVSAGNHTRDIALDCPEADFGELAEDQRKRSVISAIAADTRHRRLLSPAETLNGLTVGATHADASLPMPRPEHLIDPFESTPLPSVVCAHGPGYRRAVKPDIFLPGGRQLLTKPRTAGPTNATLKVHLSGAPPGQRAATPGNAGRLDETACIRGTSNAAALATRSACAIHTMLETLRSQAGVNLPAQYDVVLIKALLVHGADWSDAWGWYEDTLKNAGNSRTFREFAARFLGYGSANVAKVLACTEQRVTVLGFGDLRDGDAAEFRLPLPPSLSAVNRRRRLTVTLAWLSPTNCARQNYRVAHLWFDPNNVVAPNRVCADHRAVQRGTVQHEVLEGSRAVDFQDGDDVVIKVNCRKDAGEINEAIRYGLAVTLEDAEHVLEPIPIYQELRDRLDVGVRVQGPIA